MGDLTLADELVLPAYDDDGSRKLGQPALGYGLAGALLVEWAAAVVRRAIPEVQAAITVAVIVPAASS